MQLLILVSMSQVKVVSLQIHTLIASWYWIGVDCLWNTTHSSCTCIACHSMSFEMYPFGTSESQYLHQNPTNVQYLVSKWQARISRLFLTQSQKNQLYRSYAKELNSLGNIFYYEQSHAMLGLPTWRHLVRVGLEMSASFSHKANSAIFLRV